MLLRPKWIVGHVLVITLAVVFVALGFWQYGRHREQQRVERVADEQRDKPSFAAPDVATVHPDEGGRPRVSASGRYDGEHQVVVRGRLRDQDVGVGIVTPLVLDDGRAVLVDRGFVAGDTSAVPDAALAVPPGVVRVAGLARPAQSIQGDETGAPTGTPPTIDRVVPASIAATLPYEVLDVWIAMDAQDPPPPTGAPVPATVAVAGAGSYEVNHLSYALQWWAFALIPLIGWPVLLWRVTRRGRAPEVADPVA